MKKALLFIAPVLFTLMMTSSSMLVTGCGGGGSGGSGGGSGGGTGGGTADGGSDYTCDSSPGTQTAATVFTQTAKTNCADCHENTNPSNPGSGYAYGDYTTSDKMYAAMVNHPSVYAPTNGSDPLEMIKPNDLAHSTVWIKLICSPTATLCKSPAGTSVGSPMPYQTMMQLSATDLKAFKDWICTGAKQN